MKGLSLKLKVFLFVGIVSALTTMTVFAQGTVFAQDHSTVSNASVANCVVPKILDEKVPFPGKMANLKFDLAEDQIYLLKGKVERHGAQLYFRIDFDFQPYLATTERMLNPLVLLDPTTAAHVAGLDPAVSVELALQYVRMTNQTCSDLHSMGFKVLLAAKETQGYLVH